MNNLTTEMIHETAEQLIENNIKPTLVNVRNALGGGSFTTISEAMKLWRQDQDNNAQLQQIELPHDMHKHLHSVGASMWQLATSIADERLLAERDALDVAKNQASQEINEAQQAVDILEKEQAEIFVELEQSTNENEKLKQAKEQAESGLKEVEERLNSTKYGLEIEKAELHGELKAKKSEINQLKEVNEEALNKYHENEERLSSLIHDLDIKKAELQGELKVKTSQLEQFQEKNMQKDDEVSELKKKINLVDVKLTDLEKNNARLETDSQKHKSDYSNLKQSTEVSNASLRGELKANSEQLHKLETEKKELLEFNKELTVNLERLRIETEQSKDIDKQ